MDILRTINPIDSFILGSYGYSDFFDRQHGNLVPWSIVSHMTLAYSDNMSFVERWHNTIVSIFDWTVRRWITIPAHDVIARKHFGHLGDIPTIDELHQNVSIIFVNSHRSLAPPRPSLPHIIDIGGSHIEPSKPLPADIEEFLNGAENGAIYVSFGTMLQSAKMPQTKIDALLGESNLIEFVVRQFVKHHVQMF